MVVLLVKNITPPEIIIAARGARIREKVKILTPPRLLLWLEELDSATKKIRNITPPEMIIAARDVRIREKIKKY